jgi:dihydrolipoamide dehydrogenase
MPEAVDFAVIGAGPGGYTAALAAARAGRNVVLIDADGERGVGGVCLLEGCIPSKALIRLAHARHRRDGDAEMGLRYHGEAEVDLARFQEWKNSVVATLGDAVRDALRKAGVHIIRGRVSFVDEGTVRVLCEDAPSLLLAFRDLVIATGSVPVELPGLDRSDPRVVDAAGLLDLPKLPGRAAIVGAGYIGVELGTALAKLGSSVTLIEAGEGILPGLDPAAAKEVHRTLDRLGVTVTTGARPGGIGEAGLAVETRGTATIVPADVVVVAVGRRPATADLQLNRAGIKTTASGYIEVAADLRCRPHIAAIGDVTPGPGLAHRATAEARIAVAALCGQTVRVDHLVPSIVFSDPEIAIVGVTVEQATAEFPAAMSVTVPMALAGRSFVDQASRGFVTIVYDGESRRMLGATVCGVMATEIIAEATMAIEAALALGDISLVVHPHPTLGEILAEAARAAA